jgi:hypothetical protein
MDQQLFTHFVGKLYFAGNTRLRVYHNGSGEQSAIGEAWHSEDEVRRKDVEFVSSGNTTTFDVRTSADLLRNARPEVRMVLYKRALPYFCCKPQEFPIKP